MISLLPINLPVTSKILILTCWSVPEVIVATIAHVGLDVSQKYFL